MRDIRIQDIDKSINGLKILEKANLVIPGGKFFALLGPSGCGKTTLLRLIAGLERADKGKIYLGDEDITRKPIHERPINIVFQNYALFPHLTVFENVAYSLRIKRVPKEIIHQKVYRVLEKFHLESHIHKLPSHLSGGQQQRVALARAIIDEPDVLLLDEPLAALDYKLREKVLIELIEWQDELETTFIYVTHDQFEALTVADQMAIMNHQGEIEQVGHPKEIYEFPISSFVARFVGSTNTFQGRLSGVDQKPTLSVPDLGDFAVYFPEKRDWIVEDADLTLSIRPEKILIGKEKPTDYENLLEGTIQAIVYYGRSTQYTIELENKMKIQVFEQNDEHFVDDDLNYDDKVYLGWHAKSSVLLEK